VGGTLHQKRRREALKAGHSVCALARSATAIRLRDPKLQKLDGDALDQHTIEHALAGADAVIQTVGVSPNPVLIFSGTRLFSEATRILVDAMEAKAVKRLICITGLGAGDSRGHGGLLYNTILALLLGHVYADKDASWMRYETRQVLANSAKARTLFTTVSQHSGLWTERQRSDAIDLQGNVRRRDAQDPYGAYTTGLLLTSNTGLCWRDPLRSASSASQALLVSKPK
jgi:NAD(P)H-binding